MNLSDLKIGQTGIVDRIISTEHTQGIVQRLKEMGIVPNQSVKILQKAKFCNQLHVRVGSSKEIEIPSQEAEMIIVKTDISSENPEIIPEIPQELNQQVKIKSLVSLTAIMLVVISGFYRILITGHIHQVNEEKAVTNVVYTSNSQMQKNDTLKTINTSKVSRTMVRNIETINNKSNSPEKAAQTNDQNLNNYLRATTHSPPANIDKTAKKITNTTELLQLKQKLYNTIYKAWKNPINVTSIYLVKVYQNGVIASYKPFNQVAADNLKKTPIPSLVNYEPTTTGTLKKEWAEFTILFYYDGVLEIQAR